MQQPRQALISLRFVGYNMNGVMPDDDNDSTVHRVERLSACRADTAVTRSSAAAVLQFYFGPALGFMKRREMASVHLVFIYVVVYRCRAQFIPVMLLPVIISFN